MAFLFLLLKILSRTQLFLGQDNLRLEKLMPAQCHACFKQGSAYYISQEISVIQRSLCGTMGSVASWEPWDAGLIPSPAQWVKDPGLSQLWLRLQLQLRSDPWPGSATCFMVAKKERKGKEKRGTERNFSDLGKLPPSLGI